MTFVEPIPVVVPPVEQLEEMKPIKIRKKRAPKHDFKDGNGRVPAHKHDNGGGWVADTAKVDNEVYVGRRCEIFNRATVKGLVRMEGCARVSGGAVVSGGVIMRKNAHVYGKAVVRDTTEVSDDARIFGEAHVSGTSLVFGVSSIFESAQVFSTTLHGRVLISGSALVVRSTLDATQNDIAIEIKGQCSVINGNIRGRTLIDAQAQFIRSNIANFHAGAATHITDSAVVADQTAIHTPIVIKNHAVLIHSSFYGQHFDNSPENQVMTLDGRTVFQHQTFRNRVELQNYLNLLANNGGRLGAAQIMPNGQIAGFPARRINFDQPPAPRRVMRLQEAAT